MSTAPSYDDYLWATSIFWSRGLSLPVTYTEQQQGDSSSSGSGSDGVGSGGVGSGGVGSSGVLRIKVLEGLVPGLDFANHSQQVRRNFSVCFNLFQENSRLFSVRLIQQFP